MAQAQEAAKRVIQSGFILAFPHFPPGRHSIVSFCQHLSRLANNHSPHQSMSQDGRPCSPITSLEVASRPQFRASKMLPQHSGIHLEGNWYRQILCGLQHEGQSYALSLLR